MLFIQRVLFPTDFSDNAARAFPQAVSLAVQHDADLHIVNVADPSGEIEKTLPVASGTLAEWLGRDELGADFESVSLIQKQVEADVPAERLLAYVENVDIDLVVMGTHGRRGVQRMLLGSVMEEVMRKAPCPVLGVPPNGKEPSEWEVRRVLAPIDFSETSHKAVEHAKEFALTYDAKLDLLHVVENATYPSAYGLPSFRGADSGLSPTEEIMAQVEDTLKGVARNNLQYDHVRVETTMGDASMKILDYVERSEIDLIVIATHGLTGLDRFLLGSVAERVLRQSPIPVFLVKPDQKSLVLSREGASVSE
jgi:nucleotide-binding universal stress UspA family protein